MERGTAPVSFGRAPTPRSGFFPGVWDSRPDFREGFCVRATCAGASSPSPPVLSPVPPRPVGALPAAPDVGYDPDAVRAGAAAADAAANVKIRAALALVSMDDSMHKLLSMCGSPLTGGAALAVSKGIEKAHRKPRGKAPKFKSAKEREAFALESEIDALIPLLPTETMVSMFGGPRGMAQVPAGDRCEFLRRRLRAKSGSSGERVARMRHLLARIRRYAATRLRLPPEERDAACFPMSSALAHEIIRSEHEGAVGRAKGSRGGTCVGSSVREDFKSAAEILQWPIAVDGASWAAAAPKARVGGRLTKAGTLPLAAKCQLESFAAGGLPESLVGTARAASQFLARSLLCAGVDNAVRVGEGIRIDMIPDHDDPEHIMYGIAYMGKDGSALEICAPAEGLLGAYDWYPEHLRDMAALGQVFPEWQRPHGSGGSVLHAGPLLPFVAKPDLVRKGFKELLSLPPLAYTTAEIAAMNLQGHSFHASPGEWATAVGDAPCLSDADGAAIELPPELALGFSEPDVDVLGNWLRNPSAKQEATDAEAARLAPPEQARRAAAVNALPGRGATRGTMRVYYGQGGALSNRVGQRFKLLRVRQRLVHVLRAVLASRDWRALPRGQSDLALLRTGASPVG